MELLTATHTKEISGVLSCFDRIIITGTLPQICYSQGMTSYLNQNKIRIFDYPKFAEPFKDQIRSNAEKLAKANDVTIEFVSKSHIRKKDLIKRFWIKGVHTLDLSTSSQPWKHVVATNHGMTNFRVKHF